VVHDRHTFHPGPQIICKGAVLLSGGEEGAGVGHRCSDLQPVAHDAGILEESGHLVVVIAGDALRVEAVERSPVVLPLGEYRRPGQPA